MTRTSLKLLIATIVPAAAFDLDVAKPGLAPASLRSEVSIIAPGEPFQAAVFVPHPEGWHTYYQNSAGVELPPTLEWHLPSGFQAGPIQWPVPDVFDADFGKSIGYKKPITLLIEITPPADLEPGSSVTLAADLTWQYCQPGKCINDSAKLSLDLPVAAMAVPNTANRDLFEKARAALPVETEAWTFAATRGGDSMRLVLKPGENARVPETVTFIPDQPFVAPVDSIPLAKEGESYLLDLSQALDISDEPIPIGDSISGILVTPDSWLDGPKVPALKLPHLPFLSETTTSRKNASLGDFLPILGGMLLGGLILNLMPCVFPVIGLKIMGFVQQAGEDRRKIVFHGLAFAVGVLISFWVLAGILFALRTAAGPAAGIGWGYQLQNPWVVLGLMLLMFILALAMYGVFEIGASATGVGSTLAARQGLGGSFFSGVLATVVATPCSAPFLGAAIGAAVALPALQFFLAFTFMALGLAIPYLVFSIFPSLIEELPRPGPWMESFKQAMSFLLFATAGFLLWIYAGQTGLDHVLLVIFGLTLIAIAAWIYGRWDTPTRSPGVRWTARVLVLTSATLGFLACKPPEPSTLVWENWSPERVEQLLEEGRPVYVDFTARWCATCQLNKKRAYTDKVAELIKEKDIALLKADKTNPDPVIDAALDRLGRSAIPVNVLYIPGQKDPTITPELLSPTYLLGLFKALP